MHKFKMIHRLSQGLAVALAVGCGGKAPSPATTPTVPTVPEASPLSGLVGQQMLVTPTQRARAVADLNWTGVPRSSDLGAALDSNIVTILHSRDAFRNWVFGDGLILNFTKNPTYLSDPRALSIESLVGRGGTIPPGTRLVEPLASQLRSMIALHDARLVMIPVEMRLEAVAPANGGAASGTPVMGRAILRVVIVDPRASEVKWMGEIKGDPGAGYSPGIVTSVATRFANLFIAP